MIYSSVSNHWQSILHFNLKTTIYFISYKTIMNWEFTSFGASVWFRLSGCEGSSIWSLITTTRKWAGVRCTTLDSRTRKLQVLLNFLSTQLFIRNYMQPAFRSTFWRNIILSQPKNEEKKCETLFHLASFEMENFEDNLNVSSFSNCQDTLYDSLLW